MTAATINRHRVQEEWPPQTCEGIYLNSGSCGLKPRSVLNALNDGWAKLNQNPTIMSFLNEELWESPRRIAAQMFGSAAENLLLTPNSTFGIQMVMQSMLQNSGDEFVTTNQEHSCVNVLSRYLAERRGIAIKRLDTDFLADSKSVKNGILNLVNEKTRLVLVSQINCLTGWRPELKPLLDELSRRGVAVLVDGAHAPGQGPLNIAEFPFWVASAHKWMGAPNGCGFLHVQPQFRDRLQPVTVGELLYDESRSLVKRLEWAGTGDVVKLLGLEAALKLQLELGPDLVNARQKQLHLVLRTLIAEHLPPGRVHTPWLEGETSALFTISWSADRLLVPDIRDALWQRHKIWTQPAYVLPKPELGLRVSCNVFNTEAEMEQLVAALRAFFR